MLPPVPLAACQHKPLLPALPRLLEPAVLTDQQHRLPAMCVSRTGLPHQVTGFDPISAGFGPLRRVHKQRAEPTRAVYRWLRVCTIS